MELYMLKAYHPPMGTGALIGFVERISYIYRNTVKSSVDDVNGDFRFVYFIPFFSVAAPTLSSKIVCTCTRSPALTHRYDNNFLIHKIYTRCAHNARMKCAWATHTECVCGV